MLPGFRFLVAAIALSLSILIFGLGAAALLRAAHEEVASVPTRRVMPEPVFAQQAEPSAPTLAMFRVEPTLPEKTPDAPPATEPEPAPEAVPKAETEKLAALKPDAGAPAEAAGPEITAQESPAVAPAAAEPAVATETKIAVAAAEPADVAEATPLPFELIAPPPMADPDVTATFTAALGSPAAKVEKPAAAKKASEKPDPDAIKKQRRAERARERRRQAARRARLAAQQAAAQQTFDPFSQIMLPIQQPQPATTPKRSR
jgi:hypothetical protein